MPFDPISVRSAPGIHRTIALTSLLLVLPGLAAVASIGAGSPAPDSEAGEPAAESTDAEVDRGRYLVTVLACNDCHTPFKLGPEGPEPDMSRMLSGHPQELEMPPPPDLGEGPWVWVGSGTNTAYAGPWGVSFASNLTPDPSGLGAWDEEIFIRAMRTGKHWGQSRPILPPMPWPAYRHLTGDDLKAVFAYLQTVPPISNQVPEPLTPADTQVAETASETSSPAVD